MTLPDISIEHAKPEAMYPIAKLDAAGIASMSFNASSKSKQVACNPLEEDNLTL